MPQIYYKPSQATLCKGSVTLAPDDSPSFYACVEYQSPLKITQNHKDVIIFSGFDSEHKKYLTIDVD